MNICSQNLSRQFSTLCPRVETVSRAHLVSGQFKMAARTKISASLVSQFVNVTGASKDIARSLLEACNGNLEMAIEMHLDACEAPESMANSSSIAGPSRTAGSNSTSNNSHP